MQIDLVLLRSAIKGTGWAKFLAVMNYVLGAFYVLGCVTIPVGILMIILGMKLWSAASKLEQLKYQEDPNALYSALEELGSYFTWYGILTLVGIVLAVLFTVLYFLLLLPTVSSTYMYGL